ncbi:MAG: hypothetical protein H6506_00035 [Calditrichaeota bacterium]|nr:hypothetical protein [Calditrichota bacterium]MCB9391027.1 hypothetical protein [Calditrichota bacterium]
MRKVILFLLLLTLCKWAAAQELITHAEYRFDSLTVYSVDLTDGSQVLFDEIVPQSLTTGFHKFRVRFQDNTGFWSLWHADSFLVINYPLSSNTPFSFPEIIGAEYRFDSLAITALDLPDGVMVPFDEIVPQTLATGFHKFRIRFQDEASYWSLWQADSFLVINYPYQSPSTYEQPALAYAEFFRPPDPGIGNGVVVPLPEDGAWDEGLEAASSVFAGVDSGYRKFCVRFQDEDGFWTPTYCDSFYVGLFLTIMPVGSDIRLIWKCDSSATDFRIHRSPQTVGGFTEIAQTDSFRFSNVGILDSAATKYHYHVTGHWPADSLFESASSGTPAGTPLKRRIE